MSERNPQKLLETTIANSRTVISRVSESIKEPWTKDLGVGTHLALRKWMITLVRHLATITILAEEHDLSMVAGVHYRQMFEIMLQVRYFIGKNPSDWEKLAERISAWGCVDYLEKLDSLKDHDLVSKGFQVMTEQLSMHDPDLISKIQSERKNNQNWFQKSFTGLAKQVSKNGEELATVYKITSAELHGDYDLTLSVCLTPEGIDCRGYPDTATMQTWAAELVDRATLLFVGVWNDIANAVGAPQVDSAFESDSRNN